MFQDARGGAAQSFTWKIDSTHAGSCGCSRSGGVPFCDVKGSCLLVWARARSCAERHALTEARYVLRVGNRCAWWPIEKETAEQEPEAIWKMHLCALKSVLWRRYGNSSRSSQRSRIKPYSSSYNGMCCIWIFNLYIRCFIVILHSHGFIFSLSECKIGYRISRVCLN